VPRMPYRPGTRLGSERCGKIHAVHALAESWTGIGVVAGCAVVVLIRQRHHVKRGDARWRIKLIQILQEVRASCKTRNQLVILDIEVYASMQISSCHAMGSKR